jgi:hypothetical protein
MSRYPPMTNSSPIMNIRLLSLSIPYDTANMPIRHIKMIRVLFLRIYNVAFNAIKSLWLSEKRE